MRESFTTADGRRLSYEREGEGPLLVCHPGGPGFSSRYFGDLAGLGASFTLVKLNPRGTADSDRPADPRAYEISDYVADLEELRDHLGAERLDLLGHSHGGVVAMAYAAAHPTRIRRLVLMSTLPRFQAEQVSAMEAAMLAKAGEPWYEDARAALDAEQAGEFDSDEVLAELVLREYPFYFSRYGDSERAYVETLKDERPNRDALRLFNEEIVTVFDLRPELGRIEATTLVITGQDDFITGPVCAAEVVAGIPGAELVLIPDCGHFLFVEARERCRGEVARFVGG
ncbi:MAG TPA: alpha/beta hydrolase [Gaiellaceae bacterium]|nr:alpha/beta hydrolase [Gaiellaceae bacterium]